MTDHLNIKCACMNRVVHLIQNTCIKVIVTWSLILMDTFSSLIYIEECIELDLHAFYSSKRHCWYLKFTLISQGYFPLLLLSFTLSSFTCHLLWYLNDKSHANSIFGWGAHVLIFAYSFRLFFHSPRNYTYKNKYLT
jgi:hypothetical protein